MAQIIGPVYDRDDYAGFTRRTIALTIDVLILAGFHYALGEALIHLAPDDWFTEDGWLTDEASIWYEFSFWPIAILYLFGFRLSCYGTPGYRIVGIRYAYILGDKPSFIAVVYRAAIALFLLWFFGLDHIWIIFDARKQAWHDKVSGFYVVKRKAVPVGTEPVNHRVIHFMMLTFPVWEPKRGAEATA
ncbi:MAG: RDD family protein [Phycisphaerae bacterium]|nr:RDD family protein [Phycisphaerae bacterium]